MLKAVLLKGDLNMPGRKPEYRLVVVDDNGRGRRTSFKLGAGWVNESKETGEKSIGIEVNVGVPITLVPHQKLVLFANTEKEAEEDTEFERS